MLYIVYLDEFGHIGPYISHDHPQHSTHPAFGIGGIVLPYNQVRNFTTFFYKLKTRLLSFEINRDGAHPAKWEKKGSSLYRTENVEKYEELRRATFRLINKINSSGGFTIYVGTEKRREEGIDSKNLYHYTLIEIVKRLNEEFSTRNDDFMLILDQQEANVMRGEIVERISIEMFGNNSRKRLIEPPIEAESHLYQTLQCADWFCGLFGRMAQFEYEPDHKSEFEWYNRYFKSRMDGITKRSGIRPRTDTDKNLSQEPIEKVIESA